MGSRPGAAPFSCPGDSRAGCRQGAGGNPRGPGHEPAGARRAALTRPHAHARGRARHAVSSERTEDGFGYEDRARRAAHRDLGTRGDAVGPDHGCAGRRCGDHRRRRRGARDRHSGDHGQPGPGRCHLGTRHRRRGRARDPRSPGCTGRRRRAADRRLLRRFDPWRLDPALPADPGRQGPLRALPADARRRGQRRGRDLDDPARGQGGGGGDAGRAARDRPGAGDRLQGRCRQAAGLSVQLLRAGRLRQPRGLHPGRARCAEARQAGHREPAALRRRARRAGRARPVARRLHRRLGRAEGQAVDRRGCRRCPPAGRATRPGRRGRGPGRWRGSGRRRGPGRGPRGRRARRREHRSGPAN